MQLTTKTCLLYFIYLSSASVFAAKQCYQCSTTTKPQCSDLSDTTGLEKCQTTTGSDINCVMYEYMLNGRKITYRGCRTLGDTCDDVRNALQMENKEYISCSLCNTDLCKNDSNNRDGSPGGAPVDTPVMILLVGALVTLKIIAQ